MVWVTNLQFLNDREFKQRYRLNKTLFTWLVEQLKPILESKRKMSGVTKPVSVELQLAMTLRFLAGGAVVDIMDNFGVVFSTFFKCFHRTLKAVDKVLKLEFDIRDRTLLEKLEAGFAKLTRSVFRGVVGAVDGLAIRIRKPNTTEVPIIIGRASLQSIVKPLWTVIIRWFSGSTQGSSHDNTAFNAMENTVKCL